MIQTQNGTANMSDPVSYSISISQCWYSPSFLQLNFDGFPYKLQISSGLHLAEKATPHTSQSEQKANKSVFPTSFSGGERNNPRRE